VRGELSWSIGADGRSSMDAVRSSKCTTRDQTLWLDSASERNMSYGATPADSERKRMPRVPGRRKKIT